MRWLNWEQTYEGCPEWSRWDIHDEWFLTVVKKGLVWEWYVAFCPITGKRPNDNSTRVHHTSWALTRDRAKAQAQAWAEKHAVLVFDKEAA